MRRGFATNTFCSGGQGGRLWKLSSSLSYRTAAKTQRCISSYSRSQPKAREHLKVSFVSSLRTLRSAAPLPTLTVRSPFTLSCPPLTFHSRPNRRPRRYQTHPRATWRTSRRGVEETGRGFFFFFFGKLSHIFTSESANQTHLSASTNTNIPPPCVHAPPANNAAQRFYWPLSCSVTAIISHFMDLRTP